MISWIRQKTTNLCCKSCSRETGTHTQSTQWKHCPGYLNPVDDGTRGIPFSVFNFNSHWLNGPAFILQPEDAWSKPPLKTDSPSNTLKSDRQHDCVFSVTENCLPNQHHSCYVTAFQDPMVSRSCINYERFSKWNRLLRATAFVLIAATLFRNTTSKSSTDGSVSQTPHQKLRQHNLIQFPPSAISPPSTTEENRHHSITLNAYDIDLAMKFLMKKSQWVSFPNELKVPQKRNIVATSSRIRPFSLFLDESNIMRAKGRLQKSRLDYCSKHPAILDGKYPATYLLIQKVHTSNEHSPREHTRNTLQADYCILSARSQIRKMYNSCYDCRCQLAYGLQSEKSPLPS